MNSQKRRFLQILMSLGACAPALILSRSGFAQQSQPAPMPRPDLPMGAPENNPNSDAEMPKIDTKIILKQNQKEIQQDASKLFTLAQQLKNQVASTDSSNVLSLPILEKAEEIEKLAKHIRSLARG